MWGPSAQYMLSSDENPFHGVNRPMTVPMERVENRILSIRGLRRQESQLNLYHK